MGGESLRPDFTSDTSSGSFLCWAALGLGFWILPTKRGMPIVSSKMMKRKGRSRLKVDSDRDSIMLVAADASTPSSASSKVDWCWMLDTRRGSSVILRRSGAENNSLRPEMKPNRSQTGTRLLSGAVPWHAISSGIPLSLEWKRKRQPDQTVTAELHNTRLWLVNHSRFQRREQAGRESKQKSLARFTSPSLVGETNKQFSCRLSSHPLEDLMLLPTP